MNVTLNNVTPGIALGAEEADRLRKQIAPMIEAMALGANQEAIIPDFKDDRGTKRRVKFRVVAVNGRNASVDLIEMT